MLECDVFLKEDLLGHCFCCDWTICFCYEHHFHLKEQLIDWTVVIRLVYFTDILKKKLSKLACHLKEKTVLAFFAPW